MSGGHFDYQTVPDALLDAWRDEEVNAIVHDLFDGGEFSVRGYGGLLQTLDFWLSGDVEEEAYREAVARFKAKWMRRTPKTRAEFYTAKLQERCDELKRELGALAALAASPAVCGEEVRDG